MPLIYLDTTLYCYFNLKINFSATLCRIPDPTDIMLLWASHHCRMSVVMLFHSSDFNTKLRRKKKFFSVFCYEKMMRWVPKRKVKENTAKYRRHFFFLFVLAFHAEKLKSLFHQFHLTFFYSDLLCMMKNFTIRYWESRYSGFRHFF